MLTINDKYTHRWQNTTANAETEIIQKAKSILQQLDINTPMLTKNDIAAWRAAHQMALNVDEPKRLRLYSIYDFTTDIDTHVSGVVNRTILGIAKRKYKMVDDSGTENKDITKIFEAQWFYKFLKLAIKYREYYGHGLLQFGDVNARNNKMGFESVKLVPKEHVIPEYGVVVQNSGDNPKTQGVPYRKGGFADWTVEAGEADDLGLFLKVTPHVISKKHVQIFWDNFAERFGIPIIYATTETRNNDDRAKIENMLSRMGNSPWGFFPEGTKLDLIETAKGDAFEVFDKRIIRANKEISIGLAGQTMAFEDGASYSQAEVHNEGFEEIKDAFALNLKFLINDSLIPLMLKHGFPVQGYTFDWDDSHEYTPEQMQTIEQMLLNSYEIEPDYFEDKYGIKIIGAKSTNNDFFG